MTVQNNISNDTLTYSMWNNVQKLHQTYNMQVLNLEST